MRSFSLLVFVSGALLLAYIWYEGMIYLDKPKPWPTTSGKIITSKVIEPASDGSKGFQLDVKYSYQDTENKSLENSRIRPVEIEYDTKQQATEALKQFPVGKEVQVYVNPNPKTFPQTVLIWEFPDSLSPGTFIALMITIIGAIFAVMTHLRPQPGHKY